MERFQVLACDAVDEAVSLCGYKRDRSWHDYHWSLVEFDDAGKQVRVVGNDGGEPEDQTLVRDWKWVAEEMNKLEERISRYKAALEAIKDQTFVDAEGPELRAQNECNHRRASDALKS